MEKILQYLHKKGFCISQPGKGFKTALERPLSKLCQPMKTLMWFHNKRVHRPYRNCWCWFHPLLRTWGPLRPHLPSLQTFASCFTSVVDCKKTMLTNSRSFVPSCQLICSLLLYRHWYSTITTTDSAASSEVEYIDPPLCLHGIYPAQQVLSDKHKNESSGTNKKQ